jgi:hypothetical protein
MDSHVLGNVLIYAVLVVSPSAVVALLFALPKFFAGLRDLRDRRRPPSPTHPPIERLAADLRRVDKAIRELPDGVSIVRRRGTQQAYDALLRQACDALCVPAELDTMPDGLDRDLERARVEVELQRAGLVIR